MRWSTVMGSLRKSRTSPRGLQWLVGGLRAVVWTIAALYLALGVLVGVLVLLQSIPGCSWGLVLDGPPPSACQRVGIAISDVVRLLRWLVYPLLWLFGKT